MDQRREPRFRVEAKVKVTVLTEPPVELAGRLVNVSGKGARIVVESPVEAGNPVRVEVDGTILLGEVRYCRRILSKFAIGLELEEAFTVTDQLAALMRSLLEEARQPNWTRD